MASSNITLSSMCVIVVRYIIYFERELLSITIALKSEIQTHSYSCVL